MDDLRGIEELLVSRIGIEPASFGSQIIARAVKHRSKSLGLNGAAAYEQRLRQSEAELQELIEEVVVPESWFFRDDQPFQYLAGFAHVGWCDNSEREPLRILSLACASGEEPYSIAILLRDLGLSPQRFQIDAIDVSARRLAIARRGVYSANAFRGPNRKYGMRHFHKRAHGYELDYSIRSIVRFRQANVLDPGLLEESPPYNAVFCRNLLIYLGARARSVAMVAIDRLLAGDGILCIGHADPLQSSNPGLRFETVGDPSTFTFRRAPRCNINLPELPQIESPVPSLGALERSPAGTMRWPPLPIASAAETASNLALSTNSPASQIDSPSLLDQAAELANRGKFSEALAACRRHMQHRGASPSAFFLMGMICQATGDRRGAEEHFQKTLYLDPGHDDALLALALLAERRGDPSGAASFRRRAQRLAAVRAKRGD